MRHRVGVVALLIATGGCGNGTGPRAAGLSIVAGDDQTDTILATLAQELVVRVTKVPTGESVAGQVLQFTSARDSTNQLEAYVEPQTSHQPMTAVVETTNASGEAAVGIVLGTVAGHAHVVVTVPALGYVDTALFTTQPGQPARLETSPHDTAVNVGGIVAYHTIVVDQYGNPRTGAVSYRVISGPATLSGATVTMTALGTARIGGAAGTLRDTTQINVVPKGVLAGWGTYGIAVFNTDGSGLRTLPSTVGAGTLKWSPSGTAIAFDLATGVPICLGGASGLLQTIDLKGDITTVVDEKWRRCIAVHGLLARRGVDLLLARHR